MSEPWALLVAVRGFGEPPGACLAAGVVVVGVADAARGLARARQLVAPTMPFCGWLLLRCNARVRLVYT
jgi:hypothetical protein